MRNPNWTAPATASIAVKPRSSKFSDVQTYVLKARNRPDRAVFIQQCDGETDLCIAEYGGPTGTIAIHLTREQQNALREFLEAREAFYQGEPGTTVSGITPALPRAEASVLPTSFRHHASKDKDDALSSPQLNSTP